MKRAVAYIRVSTDAQTKDDAYGIPEQKEDIIKWCSENDYFIDEYFIEQVSGAKDDRPVFDRILNGAVKNPPIEAVIIARNDRLARDINIFFGYKYLLSRQDIKIISVNEDFGTFGVFAPILEAFTVSVAQLERAHITTRTSGGRKLKSREGGYSGGKRPFGYKVVNHQLVIDEHEAQIVREIFGMKQSGMKFREIVDVLNEKGYVNKSGTKWSISSVQTILNNEKTYRGYYKYGDMDWVKGKQDPILQ